MASSPPAPTPPQTQKPTPTTPSDSSAPPKSPPPPASQSPPPASQSPPPAKEPPASPPPSPPKSPPPSVPASPSPPPSSPPPSSPPPSSGGSPPQDSPNVTSSPPNVTSPSPPPPAQEQSSPSDSSSPPPPAKPLEGSPPSPELTLSPPSPELTLSPPSTSQPSTSNPPGFPLSPPPVFPSRSPPPPPSLQSPPFSPPRVPPSNSSVTVTRRPSPLSPFPTEKPSAESTTLGSNTTSNATSTNAGVIVSRGTVAIGTVAVVLALGLVIMAACFIQTRKKSRTRSGGNYIRPSPFASSQNSDSSFLKRQNSAHLEPGGVGNSKSCFTYEELAEATNGFSAQNLIGEGGFGCVYKGILVDGREVAVKQLKIGGGQGEREFRAEVEIISRVHHRHLVSLVGYCISRDQRLLVFNYVPNNSLHYHLHGEGRPVMDWVSRVKVAAGAAHGIAYLHEGCHPRIIHRDIKSSNILLDSNFEAQVADFGLAKLALDANTHVTTHVVGTFGYMAPEYALCGKLTEKSDVFSFGVVLLELITGRKPVDASLPFGEESLVEWARPLLTQALDNQDFEELVDPRLQKNFIEKELLRMIEAAASCVRHLSSKRPRMSQVVRALYSLAGLSDLTNGMKPGQSELFDPKKQSAEIRMFRRMAFGGQDWSSNFFGESQKK